MNVLMYPIAPDDDFPDEFCAIRQGSGEHWFYTPVGEDASWMLFRAESENAKLRELVARVERARRDLCDAYPDAEMLNCEECPAWNSCKGDLMDRMRELGIEVGE